MNIFGIVFSTWSLLMHRHAVYEKIWRTMFSLSGGTIQDLLVVLLLRNPTIFNYRSISGNNRISNFCDILCSIMFIPNGIYTYKYFRVINSCIVNDQTCVSLQLFAIAVYITLVVRYTPSNVPSLFPRCY